jgi:leucine dehydrogenase
VTAEDVGISLADMVEISSQTRYVCGLPVENGAAGGDPGPLTALGTYLGIKAAIAEALHVDSAKDVRVLVQGVGSVGGNVARMLAADGAKLVLADANADRAKALADELGAQVADPAAILAMEADVLSPNALGAVLNEQSIAALKVKIVAGAANNQLATAEDGARIHDRGLIFAPDYVINAGGIINVALEYLGQGSREEVEARIAQIPQRLQRIWAESKASGVPASAVADAMAQKLIGR